MKAINLGAFTTKLFVFGALLHFDPSQKQISSLVLVTVDGSLEEESKDCVELVTSVKKLLMTWLVVFTSVT